MRVILVTVGVSLLSNFGRKIGTSPDVSVSNLKNTKEELLAYLEEVDPLEATAETNNLRLILQKDDFLYFLHSDTLEGDICAKVLSEWYKKQGYESVPVKIENLIYDQKKFKILGLHSLVNALIKIVEDCKEKQYEPIFVATGGFKAEMAYVTLIGLLFGIEVHYIHEKFEDEVILPQLPIAFDAGFWLKYSTDIEWFLECPRTKEEVGERFTRAIPKKLWVLIEENKAEKTFELSPAGSAFYHAFLYRAKTETDWLKEECPLRVKGDHRALWGRVSVLQDIPDEDARLLLWRVSQIPGVTNITLGEWNSKTRPRETYLKFRTLEENGLCYKLYSKGYGIGDVTFGINDLETGKFTRNMIGDIAYP
jgi:putative CRISPR-associated protein (TIGR02619 family)